ncbi:MAG: M67 family metallopeptidase [Myxococcota bacterium]
MTKPHSVQLPETCREAIYTHGEKTFPEECCGTLLGRDGADNVRQIVRVLPIDNTKGDNRQRRYLIDPRALLAAEKEARACGLDVVGIYHSHPNHPSQASEFDRQHAMPYWSYVIVSIMDGKRAALQSWRLRDDRSLFDEETIHSNIP